MSYQYNNAGSEKSITRSNFEELRDQRDAALGKLILAHARIDMLLELLGDTKEKIGFTSFEAEDSESLQNKLSTWLEFMQEDNTLRIVSITQSSIVDVDDQPMIILSVFWK